MKYPNEALGVSGEIIYAQKEPPPFKWARKQVDSIIIIATESAYEIFVIEVKGSVGNVRRAYQQLKTAVRFFSRSGWDDWLFDRFDDSVFAGERIPCKEVWLNLFLFVGGQRWNLFPEGLRPRFNLGYFPSEPLRKAERIKYGGYGVTVADFLEEAGQRRRLKKWE